MINLKVGAIIETQTYNAKTFGDSYSIFQGPLFRT